MQGAVLAAQRWDIRLSIQAARVTGRLWTIGCLIAQRQFSAVLDVAYGQPMCFLRLPDRFVAELRDSVWPTKDSRIRTTAS